MVRAIVSLQSHMWNFIFTFSPNLIIIHVLYELTEDKKNDCNRAVENVTDKRQTTQSLRSTTTRRASALNLDRGHSMCCDMVY